MSSLPRFRPPQLGFLAIVVMAMVLGFGAAAGADHSEGAQRMTAAALGPWMLLAGLHARLDAFLRAPERKAWLSLPIAPTEHWRAAQRERRWGLALAVTAGLAGLAVPALLGGLHRPLVTLCEFAWLGLFAALIEPCIPAWSSWLGRRFDDTAPATHAQRALGGGWTSPEAVVHLYAPAVGVLGATALAMPGQLSIERAFEGMALETPHWALALAPLAAAAWLRVRARSQYATGYFESVAWLDEATRALSGDGYPRATPRFAAWVKDPWVRLQLISFWRQTPGAPLRVLALLAAPWTALLVELPLGLWAGACVAIALLWIEPLSRLRELGRATRWRRFGASLPLASSAGVGGAGSSAVPRGAWAWLAAPLVLSLSEVLWVWRMQA